MGAAYMTPEIRIVAMETATAVLAVSICQDRTVVESFYDE